MVLPREDLMARSPSVFFSAISPDGWEPFQDQDAGGRLAWVIVDEDLNGNVNVVGRRVLE